MNLKDFPFDLDKRNDRAEWIADKRMIDVNHEGYDDFMAGRWARLTLETEPNHPAKVLFEKTIADTDVATTQREQFRIEAIKAMCSIYN